MSGKDPMSYEGDRWGTFAAKEVELPADFGKGDNPPTPAWMDVLAAKREIDSLKAQLAQAQAKATQAIAEAADQKRQNQRWIELAAQAAGEAVELRQVVELIRDTVDVTSFPDETLDAMDGARNTGEPVDANSAFIVASANSMPKLLAHIQACHELLETALEAWAKLSADLGNKALWEQVLALTEAAGVEVGE